MVRFRNFVGAVSLAFLIGLAWAVYLYESGEVTPDHLEDAEPGGDGDE